MTASVPAGAAGAAAAAEPGTGPEPADGDGPGTLGHTDHDAECEVSVDILDTGSCRDTWDQPNGTLIVEGNVILNGTWHSTFHDLWTVGTLVLTVEDAEGTVVFLRRCRWAAAVGACTLQVQNGVPGTWTMRLDATVHATLLLRSVAHGWFDMPPG